MKPNSVNESAPTFNTLSPAFRFCRTNVLDPATRLLAAMGQSKVFDPAITFLGIVALATILLQIPRGLGGSDESWYLMVIRDHVSENGGAWNMLLGFLPDSLVLWRILSLVIRLFSAPLLCLGLTLVAGSTPQGKRWLPLCIFATLTADSRPVYVAAYYNLNLLAFSLSFALGTFAGKKSGFAAWTSAVFSGMFSFFLFPIMPTNFPLCVPLVLLSICVCNSKKENLVSKVFFFCLGLVVGACLFFGLCESPTEWLSMASNVASRSSSNANIHGIAAIAKWMIAGSRFILFVVLLPSIALALALHQGDEKRLLFPFLLILVFVLAIATECFFQVCHALRGFENDFPAEYPLVFATFLAFAGSNRLPVSRKASFLLLVVLIPIALSFGTAIPLESRISAYVWPLVVSILFWMEFANLKINHIRSELFRGLFLLMAGCSLLFSFRLHFVKAEQLYENSYFSRKVVDAETGLRIDPVVADNLESMRLKGIAGKWLQPTNLYDWRYVYALGCHPLSREFQCHLVDIQKAFSESGANEFFLLTKQKNEAADLLQRDASFSIVPVLEFNDFGGARYVFRCKKGQHPLVPDPESDLCN